MEEFYVLVCRHCGNILASSYDMSWAIGMKVECPNCGAMFEVDENDIVKESD